MISARRLTRVQPIAPAADLPGPAAGAPTCISECCDLPARVSGMCIAHYGRVRRGRELHAPIAPAMCRGEVYPRLAWEPLAAAARLAYRPGPKVTHIKDAGMVAALVGVAPAVAHRWRRDGVPLTQADRAADGVGVHPAELWPEWIDLVAA